MERIPPDEFILDTPAVRSFLAAVRETIAMHPREPMAALDALRPRFVALLADPTWLPDVYAQANPQSGMGGGIGQWLLFRAGDGSLSFFSLVVPPGQSTPVHDHLAWGLVGLYRGEQIETVYRRVDDGTREGYADLVEQERRLLRPGDCYMLLPPDGDIHAVMTVSETPSVSIHLLGNDTGCTWRHAFDAERRSVRAFRSGYSNRTCKGND